MLYNIGERVYVTGDTADFAHQFPPGTPVEIFEGPNKYGAYRVLELETDDLIPMVLYVHRADLAGVWV